MNKQKALEVASEVMEYFGSAEVVKDKISWQVKVNRNYFYDEEIQALEATVKKHGLGYVIEGSVLTLWEKGE